MKAIGFDLGETLIYYNNVPLSWKEHYKAEAVLSRYNTRICPKDHEVTDKEVFKEIFVSEFDI